ncbi:MAG: response regulator transcription factor [Betaproteobacteria bacterium]|nr:response regulator transcription factor [Betaproteobacteria bacterium]
MKRPELKPQHLQILKYLAEGLPSKAIARKMNLEDASVRHYLSGIYALLQVKNGQEAAAWYTLHHSPLAPPLATLADAESANPATPYDSSVGSALAASPHSASPASVDNASPLTPPLTHPLALDRQINPCDAHYFGNQAVEYGLPAALGAMSFYLGGNYRPPWDALLAGRFEAAADYAANGSNGLASTECAAVAALCLFNQARSNQRLFEQQLICSDAWVNAWVNLCENRHRQVLQALHQCLGDTAAMPTLQQLSSQAQGSARHLALIARFHLHQQQSDTAAAAYCATTLLQEAQALFNHYNGGPMAQASQAQPSATLPATTSPASSMPSSLSDLKNRCEKIAG